MHPFESAAPEEWSGAGRKLFHSVTCILFQTDPMGINFGFNQDEYEPEARTIVPRLRDVDSAEDVQRILHEEFVHWFGNIGTLDEDADAARLIWAALCSYRRGMT